MNEQNESLAVLSKFIVFWDPDYWNQPETTDQQCLTRELALNGINFQIEQPLPVEYKGVQLDCGYRIDLLIEEKVIIELKAVAEIKGRYAILMGKKRIALGFMKLRS